MSQPIGFITSQGKQSAPVDQERPSEQLVKFDSGKAIHFDEAAHNTLVLGSTGSGKTSSVILPACRQLFQEGFGGLVIDIKGNLTEQIRHIAADCGRSDDIMEFGTSQTARRANILNNLSSKESYEFFKTLGQTMYQSDDSNAFWHMQGLKMASDVLEVLRAIKAHNKGKVEVPADILAVNDVLNDPELAWEIFDYFKTIHNKNKPTHKRIGKRVNADTFHIFKREKDGDEHYAAQTSWRLSVIRSALDLFAETPGLENFSAPGKGINLERLIYTNKKIVVLSFDATAGEMARALSRHLIEAYYKAVLKRGLGLQEGQYTFLVADEFQDSANFDSVNRWNDNVFTSKSREFRSIQVFASQSLSSLISRGASPAQVDEFLNNCNNRLFFYGDDTLTQQAVTRFNESIALSRLEPGECFVVRYSLLDRRHLSGLETLQTAHNDIKALLSSSSKPLLHEMKKVQGRVSLEDLFAKLIPMKKEEKIPPFLQMKTRFGDQDEAKEWAENKNREQEAEVKAMLPEHVLALVEKYPAFFPPDCYASVEIPIGWVGAVEKALETVIRASGGKVTGSLGITAWTGARFGHPGLHAYTQKQSFIVPFLNKLIADIHFCPLCGARHDDVDKSALCKKCSMENNFYFNTNQDVVPF